MLSGFGVRMLTAGGSESGDLVSRPRLRRSPRAIVQSKLCLTRTKRLEQLVGSSSVQPNRDLIPKCLSRNPV